MKAVHRKELARYPMFNIVLLQRFIHQCYSREVAVKTYEKAGLSILILRLIMYGISALHSVWSQSYCSAKMRVPLLSIKQQEKGL